MGITEITTNNFDESVKDGVSIVDFWAPWCAPCNMLTPIMKDIAENATNFKVFKVNVDNEQELANKFNIMSIPCIKIMKNGEAVEEIIGLTTKENIIEIINKFI